MKTIALLISLALLAMSPRATGQTATAPESGDGSPETPYQIATLENLYWITVSDTAWSRSFIQSANINAAASSTWNSGQGFSPIGNTTTSFTGSYDGQGYAIDSLHIDRGTWGDYQGMFGHTSTATISNLGLTNVSIVCGGNSGALIGYAYNSTNVNGCYTSGSVSANEFYVGGLVGVAYYWSAIRNSFSTCSVTGDDKTGGLIGFLQQYSTVSNCYARGTVSRKVSGGGTEIGAFCGRVDNGSISRSYTTGSVVYLGGTDPTDKGFVGAYNSGTPSNNFCDTTASNQTAGTGATVETTERMKTPWVYVKAGWDFALETANGTADVWDMDEVSQAINDGYPILGWQNGGATALTVIASPPASGDGTSGAPYTIGSVYNLYWLTLSDTAWSRHIIQTADINAGGSTAWPGGSGFSPIGTTSTYFTGTYNGQGFTVDSIHINRPSADYQGMFGAANGGTISKLSVTNVSISGGGEVGGLIGYAFNHTNVDSCRTSGSVSGAAWYVGGIAGLADYYCTINNSSSTCSVTGDDNVGGFAGLLNQYSTAGNCYSRGTVSRTVSGSGTQIGAFCGWLQNGTITNSYTTGSVSYPGGTDPADKGFIGLDNAATFSNNFCDTSASNQTAATGATMKTTEEMKALSTFSSAGWDFVLESANGTADPWDMDTTSHTVNDGYPFLSWENGGTIFLPVQMSALSAVAEERSVRLTWRTETEVDNAGWEVERRQIADFGLRSADWKKVGFVAGGGTSSSPRTYSYADLNPQSAIRNSQSHLAYRLKQLDHTGAFTYSHEVEVVLGSAPAVFSLGQNYPNPFNPVTTIEFGLPVRSAVRLTIINTLGQVVAVVTEREYPAGMWAVQWVPAGASGVYFCRFEASNLERPAERFVETRKMLYVK